MKKIFETTTLVGIINSKELSSFPLRISWRFTWGHPGIEPKDHTQDVFLQNSGNLLAFLVETRDDPKVRGCSS